MATAEIIDFGDIEAEVIAILKLDFETSLPGVKVSTKKQPGDFLKITRSGGTKESMVHENARVLLEAYGSTETRAIAILSRGRGVLNAQQGVLFGVTEVGGPNNLPDPTTHQIRYTQLLGVRKRGAVTA